MHLAALIVGSLATILSSSVMGFCSIWLHESNRFAHLMAPYYDIIGGDKSNTTSYEDEVKVKQKFQQLIQSYINETDDKTIREHLKKWKKEPDEKFKETELNLYNSVIENLQNLLGPDFSHYVQAKDNTTDDSKDKEFDQEFKHFLCSFRTLYKSYGYTDPYLNVCTFFSVLEIVTAGLLLYGANEQIWSLLWPWFIVNIIIFIISVNYMVDCFKYNYATLGIIIICILLPFRVVASIAFITLHKKIRFQYF